MRYDLDLIYYKKGQHALECVQKGIATSYEQIKANPAQRLQTEENEGTTPSYERRRNKKRVIRTKNQGRLKSSTPTGLSRTIRFVASCFAQTAIMDNCVIRQHGHDATAHSHPTSQFLVAHDAMPLVSDDDMAVPAALSSGFTVAEL